MHESNAVKLEFSAYFIVRVHLIIDFELINTLHLIPSHQDTSIAPEASLFILEEGCYSLIGRDFIRLQCRIILVEVAIDDEIDILGDFLPQIGDLIDHLLLYFSYRIG